ncbi:hypothetical protein [Burkholderia mayonis]|uniref:hypothetical protein n=1 Tax=Burkholderia mayonis TaxID=1385591 RepID=UPI000D339B70|nr:hypothetical protein [Burkholderia mayonis]
MLESLIVDRSPKEEKPRRLARRATVGDGDSTARDDAQLTIELIRSFSGRHAPDDAQDLTIQRL